MVASASRKRVSPLTPQTRKSPRLNEVSKADLFPTKPSLTTRFTSSFPARRMPHYRAGDVVWAFMESFPWWPGRIITRPELELDQGQSEPEVPPGAWIVMFFNTDEFVVCTARHLRPFDFKNAGINGTYVGSYSRKLRVAVDLACKYVIEKKCPAFLTRPTKLATTFILEKNTTVETATPVLTESTVAKNFAGLGSMQTGRVPGKVQVLPKATVPQILLGLGLDAQYFADVQATIEPLTYYPSWIRAAEYASVVKKVKMPVMRVGTADRQYISPLKMRRVAVQFDTRSAKRGRRQKDCVVIPATCRSAQVICELINQKKVSSRRCKEKNMSEPEVAYPATSRAAEVLRVLAADGCPRSRAGVELTNGQIGGRHRRRQETETDGDCLGARKIAKHEVEEEAGMKGAEIVTEELKKREEEGRSRDQARESAEGKKTRSVTYLPWVDSVLQKGQKQDAGEAGGGRNNCGNLWGAVLAGVSGSV